jgi:hypothetical protein
MQKGTKRSQASSGGYITPNPAQNRCGSGLELNRQLGAHSRMVVPPRQLPSGLVTKNLRPVLEPAGPADAAGAFRIVVTSPEILFFFLGMGPQLAVYLEATRGRATMLLGSMN